MNKKIAKKTVAAFLMLTMGTQIIYPNRALALTSGPSQPEVQSFEPVGTTDMVDLFSGDFVYNIPLLDIEGYPINISYHSGLNVEQEASWVGLGWNINPGVINRAVRGLPDDFNGDVLEKKLNIKPEKNLVVSSTFSAEFFGFGFVNVGMYVTNSNYKGVGVGFTTGAGVSAYGFASAGVNMGISSQNGADIDYNASLGYSTSNSVSRDFCGGVSVNASSGYNTRSGMKDVNLSVGAKYNAQFSGKKLGGSATLFSTTIPIGLQNYVPVITNRTLMTGWGASIGLGGEIYGAYLFGNMNLQMSKLTYEADGNRPSYGYMYMQNAGNVEHKDILDFTRDKDGAFNTTMHYLPPAATTYDVYSINAQGSGGIFRPMRNDNGTVYDPAVNSYQENNSAGLEAGLGNLFELGGNYTYFSCDMKAGPWDGNVKDFTHKKLGSVYENVFFKQAGELTEVNKRYYDAINGTHAVDYTPDNLGSLPNKRDSADYKREPRGNLIYYLTNREAAIPEMSFSMKQLQDYTDANGLKNGPSASKSLINRTNGTTRPDDRISEIIQVNKDGSRYVYGLPVLNNVQKEVTFSVDNPSNVNATEGTVSHDATYEDNISNNKGQENYYSSTVTPAYAHSYLLTDVLSTDYADFTGDGPSNDDIGTYVKFNYSRKSADYRWKTPYPKNVAQYSTGFYSDKRDDKASYVAGSKEQWYLHSMETKNFVAEFYTSARKDAKGAEGKVLPASSMYASGSYGSEPYNTDIDHNSRAVSYKLDSIKLYSKHDRYLHQDDAVPVKTVYFEYNYQLCGGSLNSDATTSDGTGSVTGGKLTLQKIYMKYGNSDKNLLSPYQFSYNSFNPSYNFACKDRWGNYKHNSSTAPNYEFPYVDQNADNDENASAWLLDKVTLPSGGVISVNYESDDYGYVQNKRAMEMFKVEGVGASSAFYPNENLLYANKYTPYTYIYFKRRQADELNGNLSQTYLEGQSVIYYNFGVDIANKGGFEFVRGYADVDGIGVCSDNSNYGWVKVRYKVPDGSDAHLSPITYTGLNMARYYLPHLFYPGSDPDESDLENVLKGLVSAMGDIINLWSNPMETFVQNGKARSYNKDRSFIRLSSPGMNKKGGGSRVKQIKIDDSWSAMAGGDNASSEFGNNYDYSIDQPGYGKISSGVASYEPLIGGDENPFRMPASYIAANGGHFPPNDPVELYQEEPIGESLYPSPNVGYRKISVNSIHKANGRSTQSQDEYEFYTAKDFPIRVEYTAAQKTPESQHGFFYSLTGLTATQGYSIIMNDMHGKPKTIKNYAYKGELKELINGQTFVYNTNGDKLDNSVNVVDYDRANKKFYQRKGTLGQDIDVTVDSRLKDEHSHNRYVQANLNCFLVWIIPIPIPTAFFPSADHDRRFKSLVSTKVVQEYGILKAVETIKEGAKYYKENLAWDRESGDVLLTKVNNEYRDSTFEMSYPAYWGYRGMGPAYRNILYIDSVQEETNPTFAEVGHDPHFIHLSSVHGTYPYQVGDELLCEISIGGVITPFKLWIISAFHDVRQDNLVAHARNNTALSNSIITAINQYHQFFTAKVIRSGYRNMLNAPMQEVKSMDRPKLGTGNLFNPEKVISTNITTYSDSQVLMMPPAIHLYTDTNCYTWGYVGNFRPIQHLSYLTNRDYSNSHNRYDGVYPISMNYFMMNPTNPYYYSTYSDNQFKKSSPIGLNPAVLTNAIDFPWKASQTVKMHYAEGNEAQSYDALKIPSAALFGFNNTKPISVATNAKHYETLSESFEDYSFLYLKSWQFTYSPIRAQFPQATVPSGLSPYKYLDSNGNGHMQLSTAESHTGKYSLKVSGGDASFTANVFYNHLVFQYWDDRTYPFTYDTSKKYIASIWARPGSMSNPAINVYQFDITNTGIPNTGITLSPKSNVIDGWQLYEGSFYVTNQTHHVTVNLPSGYYYDDIRIYPSDGNMKAFVYGTNTQKLIGTLDENNFATMYEYDNEGQLIRINKETERGILTVQESRNANVKKQ